MFKNEHCANVRNCYPYHGKPPSPSLTSPRLGNSAHAAGSSEGMTEVPAGSHQLAGTVDEADGDRGREGDVVAATTASSLRQLFISLTIVYSSEDTIRP